MLRRSLDFLRRSAPAINGRGVSPAGATTLNCSSVSNNGATSLSCALTGRAIRSSVGNGTSSPSMYFSSSSTPLSPPPSPSSSNLQTAAFDRLVRGLKDKNQTVTVVESSMGGLFSASVMSIPGSSAVYHGGTTVYNTRKSKPLLCDDDALHTALLATDALRTPKDGETEEEAYINSKLSWTAEAALAYGRRLGTDYVVAEGGATGPTFRPEGMETGFAVLAVAGKKRRDDIEYEILAQTVVRSTHADRAANMRLFADAAADLCADAAGIQPLSSREEDGTAAGSDSVHVPWLDRSSHLRADSEALREMERRPDALHVVLKGPSEALFRSASELDLLTAKGVDGAAAAGDGLERTFLGRVGETQTPVFAVSLPKESLSDESALTDADKEILGKSFHLPELQSNSNSSHFGITRTLAPLLHPNHNELALYATALVQWRHSHKCCNLCGSPMEPVQGGTCLKCTNDTCNTPSWPRQDPSIIVLVSNHDSSKALLARSVRHPPKLYTALAGFVEAGETFESAVAREAHEETGVRIDPTRGLRYVASQPWPFPRSSMIGFRATADDGPALNVDTNELVDAKWFDKEAVRRAAEKSRGATMKEDVAREVTERDPDLELIVPPKGVLARTLIDDWLADDS